MFLAFSVWTHDKNSVSKNAGKGGAEFKILLKEEWGPFLVVNAGYGNVWIESRADTNRVELIL